MRKTLSALGLGGLLVLGACNAKLPEADSPGAKLYAERCNSCHRVYAPGSLKYPMWEFQVERMQGELVRRGLAPLTSEERATILAYLKRHSG
jgi:mono/diheme cytochrome c family protein